MNKSKSKPVSKPIVDHDAALAAVREQMAAKGLNPNRLLPTAAAEGVTRSTVYQFCAGKRKRINLPDFLAICRSVGLEITATPRNGFWRKNDTPQNS